MVVVVVVVVVVVEVKYPIYIKVFCDFEIAYHMVKRAYHKSKSIPHVQVVYLYISHNAYHVIC